jgi:hypothetical protein
MATPHYWTKVAVDVQSALGSVQTVSGITKASPGVLTYVGADPANGDYFLLLAQGMREVHNRIVRVANVNAGSNTYELDGLDTSAFTTFTSGTMYPITFGTSISTMLDFSSEGGEPTMDDQATIHDDVEIMVPVRFSATIYKSNTLWDRADAGFVALRAASDAKAARAIRFTLSDGQKHAFYGYVGYPGVLGGSAPGKITSPLTITSQGRASDWTN